MFGFIGQWGWPGLLVIGVIALVLFGSRGQIPAFMRDIGRGINSFRSGLKEGADEAESDKDDDAPAVEAQEVEIVEVEAAPKKKASAKKPATKKASTKKASAKKPKA
ncbi:MAG: Sec-independent protein translocase subunit TatA/TatB [Alphaproteobacteria bacterium]